MQLEPSPMPANDGLWLDNDQRSLPARSHFAQRYPKQTVRSGKSRLRKLPLQDAELLPKCQVFQEETAARTKQLGKWNRQEPQMAQHLASLTR